MVSPAASVLSVLCRSSVSTPTARRNLVSAPLTMPPPCSSWTAAARRRPCMGVIRAAEVPNRSRDRISSWGRAGSLERVTLGSSAGPCSATVTLTSAVLAVAARSIIGTGGRLPTKSRHRGRW